VSHGVLQEKGKPEGHVSQGTSGKKWHVRRRVGEGGGFTSHVLFAFKHDKGVSSMVLLLLVGLLMSACIDDDSDLQFELAGCHRIVDQ
jgi:hypothetical protein